VDIGGYWATFVSIILGLGVADLLMDFHRLLHERKRVDWDALPLVWGVIALLWIINYWWAVAANLTLWSEARFVIEFALGAIPPILLVLMAASLLPRAMPAEGRLEMRAEWQKARGLFLSLAALYQCLAWINVTLSSGALVWDFVAIVRTVLLAALVLALVLNDRRADWIAALVILTMLTWRLAVQPVG
jgi:hypothetical protein